jgi:transcriptional regulator of acetoin/glycerol metabolism
LYRQPWPGNVTELRQALRSAHARAGTEALTVRHLPRHVQREPNRRPLHGLRQQEADAIVAAISSTATRADAARQLGISRATLFRRIKAYGLDLDCR